MDEAAGRQPPNARRPLTLLVELYVAWHAAEPDQGYDAKAAELRAKLPTTQPGSVDTLTASQPTVLPTPSGTP